MYGGRVYGGHLLLKVGDTYYIPDNPASAKCDTCHILQVRGNRVISFWAPSFDGL